MGGHFLQIGRGSTGFLRRSASSSDRSLIMGGGLQIHDTQSLASSQKQRSRDKREELYLGLKKFDPLPE
ncbi:hypothetical protein LWI28_018064 [Acer negundo]|uniref:Uncharacterized protein n=1 Tax=Acer negundo TaxID=4023 RepID=A0AAD5IN51_ACENE|nr:hypothetical protein LWI28_018064 [Acer negundo]